MLRKFDLIDTKLKSSISKNIFHKETQEIQQELKKLAYI